jgi:Predicted metal-dependent enzyme
LSKNKLEKEINTKLNTVGGQAVLEGVMMKSKEQYSVAVRKEDGSLAVKSNTYTSIRKKIKIFNIPVIRGFVNFIEMMILSFKTLMMSAEAMGLEELEESKFEKWLQKHFGKSIMNFIMVISTVLGLALGMGLFFFLPIFITKTIDNAAGQNLGWFKNLIEGLLKIVIFIGYLWAVSFMKDIRRTFEYHGAEHKSIFCYESGEELTPENVKKYVRFHPRCGTSFMFVMLFLSIIVFSLPFITWDNMLLRMVTKIALMPVVVGIGYEFIMYAGKHSNNFFIRMLSAPGLWIQRITTREPDLEQIEVAITALKSSMPSEFPDFKVPGSELVEQDGENIEKLEPDQGTF